MNPFDRIFLTLILIANTAFAQQPTSYTLQQSIELALANNLQVKQNELQVQSAEINLRQAKSNLLPDLSANINHGSNQGRSIDPFTNSYSNRNLDYANYAVNGGITLFSGLVLRNLLKQNALAYQASKMEQQQAKDDLTLKVVFAYFQILNNEEQLNQAQLQAEVSRKQVERANLLSQQGVIAAAQLAELSGQLAGDELSVIDNRNRSHASRIALAQLMNVEYNREFKIERLSSEAEPNLTDLDPQKIYTMAVTELALIKGTILRKESAKKAVSTARGSLYPQISLNSTLFSNYSSAAKTSRLLSAQDMPTNDYVEVNGAKFPVMAQQRSFADTKIDYNNQIKNNYSSSVSIGLRIPLLNSFRTRNQIAQAKIELTSAELAEESTKLQVKQAVDLAWFNMNAATERLKAFSKQVSAFRDAFRAAEVRFNAGVGTVIDYTIAKNRLDQANLNLINARYDWLLRTKILDYYKGELILF